MSTATVVRYEDLQPGQRVRITQRVKVGFKIWQTEVLGVVERTERRRNGLHVKRNFDDRAWTSSCCEKRARSLKRPPSPSTNTPASNS
jgi:hypothetical protein